MARFDFAYKDLETLFIVHSIDYQIDHFNIKKNRIEKIIKRKYNRVKRPPEKREPRPGVVQAPQEEYYYDISKLLVVGDRLWVITSTTNERKCRLVDVYDMQGRYLDNFYLEFPTGIVPQNYSLKNIAVRNGFLYTADEHEDGTVSIGKYEIVDEVKRK
jgi:histidinol phosphatase-like enzyme